MTAMRISTATFYDNSAAQVAGLQSKLVKIQNQISTGKRINLPSDDPIGSAAASIAKDKMANVAAFQTVVTTAQGRIDLSSSKVQSIVDVLQRVNELSVQSRNPTYSKDQLAMIGKEVIQLGEELANIANSQDGQGNYLFAGTRNQVPPFSLSASGYQYQGDQTNSFVRTGANEMSQTGWNGFSLFESAFSGDGAVDAKVGPANTGTVFVGDINETSLGAYNGTPYQIDFSLNAVSGKMELNVTDTSTSTVVSGPIEYVKNMSLNFGNVNIQLKGDPSSGDSVSVGRAERISVLNVVRDLGQLLDTSATKSMGEIMSGLANSMRSVESAFDSMVSNLALMGAESNSLDFRANVLSADSLALEMERSDYEDLDYAKAISDLQKQQMGLEASMQTFVKISNLSLFNFLR